MLLLHIIVESPERKFFELYKNDISTRISINCNPLTVHKRYVQQMAGKGLKYFSVSDRFYSIYWSLTKVRPIWKYAVFYNLCECVKGLTVGWVVFIISLFWSTRYKTRKMSFCPRFTAAHLGLLLPKNVSSKFCSKRNQSSNLSTIHFILKNFKTGHFLMNWICREIYDAKINIT